MIIVSLFFLHRNIFSVSIKEQATISSPANGVLLVGRLCPKTVLCLFTWVLCSGLSLKFPEYSANMYIWDSR